MLATTILLFILIVASAVVSSRFAALFGVEMAVGVIVAIAVDTVDVFGALTAPPLDNFGFFLTVLPNKRFVWFVILD